MSSSRIATGISGTSRYGHPPPVNRKGRFSSVSGAVSGVCIVNVGLLELGLDHNRREVIHSARR
jgi:hypothetical protein